MTVTPEKTSPILQDVPEQTVSLEEAYQVLLGLTQGVDGRSYLKQIHLDEEGYAAATNAHILGILPMDPPDESLDVPVVDIHKTDAVRPKGAEHGLEIVCTHKRDKSQVIEPVPCEDNPDEFPNVDPVWPDTDERLRIRLNKDYIQQLVEVVSGDEPGVVLEFCRDECSEEEEEGGINTCAPVKVIGDRGVGLIMPLRMET